MKESHQIAEICRRLKKLNSTQVKDQRLLREAMGIIDLMCRVDCKQARSVSSLCKQCDARKTVAKIKRRLGE